MTKSDDESKQNNCEKKDIFILKTDYMEKVTNAYMGVDCRELLKKPLLI